MRALPSWAPARVPCLTPLLAFLGSFLKKQPWQPGTPCTNSRALLTSYQHIAYHSSPFKSDAGTDAVSAAPGPLHACLLRYGITDVSAFSTRRHLQLSQEAVEEEVAPKLALLTQHGLTSVHLQRLLGGRSSPLHSSFTHIFHPNVALLEDLAKRRQQSQQQPQQAQQLTEVGSLLAASPPLSSKYLRQQPQQTLQLLGWLDRKLGMGAAQVAASPGLLAILSLSPRAQEAMEVLEAQGTPLSAISRVLWERPAVFGIRPSRLETNMRCVQRELRLAAPAVLQLTLGQPSCLQMRLDTRLPPLLAYLDEVMGEAGGSAALVQRAPVLLNTSRDCAQQCVARLAERGYKGGALQEMLRKAPGLITHNLGSPMQQQKLDWITQVSPWTLADFLVNPRYLVASTRRLASRLDFLVHHNLPPSASPGALAVKSDQQFMAALRKQVLKGGTRAALPEWRDWEEGWLASEAGRRWGFST